MLLSAGLVLFTVLIRWRVAAVAVVDYTSEEVIARNGNSGLHVVLVFHTTEAREMLLQNLVLPLSDKNKQLAFVLVDRQKLPDVARAYYVPHNVSECYIMVVPPGKREGIHVPPSNIPYTVNSLSHLFASMLSDEVPQEPSVPFIAAQHFHQRLAATHKNVIAAFCWDGNSSHCKDYSLVLDGALTPEQRQYIEPMVVTVQDQNDVPDMIVPSISVYNVTSRQWTMLCEANLTTCLALLHPSPESRPQRPKVHHWLAEELKEDDYFGLVTRKESPIVLPSSLLLTDKTFVSHVAQYNTTAVVFCLKWSVRCKHLFVHVMSAAEELDKGGNNSFASLKVVSCGDFPDVCAWNNITSYPTVLVFHGNTEQPNRYWGMLDVDHLLQAVGLHPPAHYQLAELRPDTLHTLFSSHPGSALVLLCMTQEKAQVILGSLPQNSRYPGLTWAWVDSQYFPLLQKLVPTLADGSVLILDFANGKVYYNPPSPQLKPLSAFVEDYLGERLEPDGTFRNKQWLPLQPSISFPSSQYENTHTKKASKISKISHHPSSLTSGHDEL